MSAFFAVTAKAKVPLFGHNAQREATSRQDKVGVLLRSKKAYWFSGAAVLAAIVFSIDAGMSYQDVFHSRRAIVVQEIAARKGNSMDYQPAFDQPLKEWSGL